MRIVRPAASALVAALVVLPASAGAEVTDVELRSSVTPLVPQVRTLAAGGSVVALQRRSGRYGGEVSADVLFDFGRAAVRPAGRASVLRLARRVAGRSGTLRVVGHTDGVGDGADNRRLSRRRAGSVAMILRRAFPATVRITTLGRGEDDPIAAETTAGGEDDPDGRARNRRVQLRFTPR
jgi:outer membrane protein OmpA-like peptidoglycan-associated protein